MIDKRDFFIQSRHKFTDKAFYITLFAVTLNLPTLETKEITIVNDSVILDLPKVLSGFDKLDNEFDKFNIIKIKTEKKEYLAFVSLFHGDKVTLEILSDNVNKPLFGFSEEMYVKHNEIENYQGLDTIRTSYGRYFSNYVFLVYPFGNKIPYINDIFRAGDIEKTIVSGLLDGSLTKGQSLREVMKKYTSSLYLFGHFSEICVPTSTLKSIVVADNIRIERERLINLHKGELEDPIVAVSINKKLIQMDKDNLKGDPAERFHNALGNSSWNLKRAKMYNNIGGIPAFTDEVGKITFIKNSLSDEWDKNHFDDTVNEVYKGSYSRGTETALAGEQTKIVMRMFQGSGIVEEDCGSTGGITFFVTKENANSFDGMYEAVSNKIITTKNIQSYIGKYLKVRSPMYCKTGFGKGGGGFCLKCFGEFYRQREVKALGLDGVVWTSTFMLLKMKNMHGTELKNMNIIGSFSDYFVSNW